jgi:hypothetical protein
MHWLAAVVDGFSTPVWGSVITDDWLDEAKQSSWLDLIINQEHVVFLLSRQVIAFEKEVGSNQ